MIAVTEAQWAFFGVAFTAICGLLAAIERSRRENNRDHAATRDTILELRDDVRSIDSKVDRIDSRVERMDSRVDRLDSKLQQHLNYNEGDNR